MTGKAIDTIKVVAANIGAGLINWGDVQGVFTVVGENLQTALSIVSLVLAIGYTTWKWKNDILKKRANIKKHNQEKIK